MAFDGFPDEAFSFLKGLAEDNSKDWFQANRKAYEKGLMDPAKAFVTALGERLTGLDPAIVAEPRVNGSIFRINRDVRFSKDKTPYKTHLDLWFWHGEGRTTARSGFYFRMFHDRLLLGAGCHTFSKEQLAAYREAVAEAPWGDRAAAIVAGLRGLGGVDVGGLHYKRVPRGLDPEHRHVELLKHNALFAGIEMPLPAEAGSAAFADWCLERFRPLAPLHQLMVELSGV